MSQIASLKTTLMIMINASILFHSGAAKEVTQKYGSTISSQITLRHHKHSPDVNNCSRYSASENGKTKPVRSRQRRLRDLELIIIKLMNVIGRYDVNNSELNALFSGVVDCGLNKCEKFRGVLPENKQLKDFNCRKFKHQKSLKKWTYKLLSEFCNVVQSYHEGFQELINYEKSPRFKKEDRSNGSRLKILNKLKNDLKTLGVEVVEIVETEAVRKNKRLNFSHNSRKGVAPTILPSPISQTDLMIREWAIIQHSKEFLKNWKKKLHRVSRCTCA